MRRFFFFLAILGLLPAFGQEIAGEHIDPDSVRSWDAGLDAYEGIYHFGFSEAESELLLIVDDQQVYAQLRQWEFTDDGQNWVMTYQNFEEVSITKDLFRAANIEGDFVSCVYEEERRNGLRIDNPWSPLMTEASYEIGLKQNRKGEIFDGRFPQASSQSLSESTIRILELEDIRIMRNEIFARYGYIFREGGEMESYFKQQAWYKPAHKNVDDFLTELEKKNIRLIQSVEARN
ncbi:MAG: YARHG domain-containing protein [Bacteroidota bacterium]